ncbi:MAG: WD40-like beta Propeller containing protein [Verrucomicrobia bacterium]|nr:WD40-like beta Propeller containing protein [Verrucomicrobiota bacterium]
MRFTARERSRLGHIGSWILLIGLALRGAIAAGAPSIASNESGPLTITPFQTATFVQNGEAARLLNDLAEFSTRLLYWADTPRTPVTTASRVVKTAFLPFIDEWKGNRKGAPPLTADVVIERVSDGFRSLESRRIVRVDIADQITFAKPQPAGVLDGRDLSVPFVITNSRKSPTTVVLARAAGGEPLHTLALRPGQSLGFFSELPCAPSDASVGLIVRAGGLTKELEIPVRHFAAGALVVSVRDERGRVTPARVYLSGADGRSYAPAGAIHRIVTGDCGQPFAGDCYFHTTGDFRTELPAGSATIEVVKGMEYLPVTRTLAIPESGTATCEIQLSRVADLPREGWYSGEVHVHGNLFAEQRIAPGDVLLAAKAEDLHVTNILPCNDPRTTVISDRQFFTGAPAAVSEKEYVVYYNEEMRNDIYGHVGLLNLKTFVEPAYFGWAHSPFPYDVPGNFPQVEKTRAQGGVVTYVHPGLPSEFPVDIALGLADTIDAMSQNDEEVTTRLWYRLLNCGFRCPISAGTDSFLNTPCHLIPGAGRLFVHVGADFTYENWIEGYRRGRSFASNGPLLRFSVNGHEAGDDIRSAAGPVPLEISGSVQSIVPMDAVEIIINGQVVKRIAAGPDRKSIHVAEKIAVTGSSWVALRVRGPGNRLVPNDREVYAHTSPVYVTVGGRAVGLKEDALFFVDQIDALIARMEERGRFENRGQRDEIVRKFREGQAVYRKIAASAALAPPSGTQ